MEVSIENTGDLTRRLTVQVPAERVDQEVESRLQSMSRTVRLDGFRPGKVPLKVIEQKYGEQIRLEVVDQVVKSTFQEALTQESIRLAGDPNIVPADSRPGESLEYVATFEVFPEMASGINYNFKVSKPHVDIAEDDITGMLENLRKQHSTWSDVDRASQADDQLTIDFEGSVGGKSFSGNKAEKMPIVLGSGSMTPGFEEQLIGLSAGDEKVIDITFPDDYQSSDVAGKAAQFKVKVHTVSGRELPVLDDEFAQVFGVAEGGLTELKAEVTRNMERELKGLIAARIKGQIFDGLMDNNPIGVPRSMVDSEIKSLQAQQENQALESSVLEAKAEKRVKLGVIVSEVAKQNQIQLDPDRVRGLIEVIAASYEKPEEVVQWYYSNQDALSGVQSAAIEEQVVDWVVEHSDIELTEVNTSFSELVNEARQSQG